VYPYLMYGLCSVYHCGRTASVNTSLKQRPELQVFQKYVHPKDKILGQKSRSQATYPQTEKVISMVRCVVCERQIPSLNFELDNT